MSHTILEQVKIRLRQFHIENQGAEDESTVFDKPEDDPFLEQLISQAMADVRRFRHYPASYSEERITKDMNQYESVIVDLVLYDYNKEGGEFQTSSSENGTSRNWIDREKILAGVVPFVKIL